MRKRTKILLFIACELIDQCTVYEFPRDEGRRLAIEKLKNSILEKFER